MAKGFILKIPDELHTNIKVTAFTNGMTMMDYMLGILAKEFSDNKPTKKSTKTPKIEGIKKESKYTKEELAEMSNVKKRSLGL